MDDLQDAELDIPSNTQNERFEPSGPNPFQKIAIIIVLLLTSIAFSQPLHAAPLPERPDFPYVPYHFPIEQLVHTSKLKIPQPALESHSQTTSTAGRKWDPMNPFDGLSAEMVYIISRYPEIRSAILDALDKEVKLGNLS